MNNRYWLCAKFILISFVIYTATWYAFGYYIKHLAIAKIHQSLPCKFSADKITIEGYPYLFRFSVNKPSMLCEDGTHISTKEILIESTLTLSNVYVDVDNPIQLANQVRNINHIVELQEGSRVHLELCIFDIIKNWFVKNKYTSLRYLEYDDSGFAVRDVKSSRIILSSRRNEVELYVIPKSSHIDYKTKAILYFDVGPDTIITPGEYAITMRCSLRTHLTKKRTGKGLSIHSLDFLFNSEKHQILATGGLYYDAHNPNAASGALNISIKEPHNAVNFIGYFPPLKNTYLLKQILETKSTILKHYTDKNNFTHFYLKVAPFFILKQLDYLMQNTSNIG